MSLQCLEIRLLILVPSNFFHFPLLLLSNYLPIQFALSAKLKDIEHLGSFLFIIIYDNRSFFFVTFSIPEEREQKAILISFSVFFEGGGWCQNVYKLCCQKKFMTIIFPNMANFLIFQFPVRFLILSIFFLSMIFFYSF